EMKTSPALLLVVLLVVLPLLDAAKILMYDYKFQRSHVQFINTVAEILVDEGHDVVMLSNVLDGNLRDEGTNRVRRYFIEQSAEAEAVSFSSMGSNHWKSRGFYDWLKSFEMRKMAASMSGQCVAMLHDHHLIDQLSQEEFDVALTTPNDKCIYYVFFKAGISNYAVIDSHSTLLSSFQYSGIPDQLSTVPGRFSSCAEMNFSCRLKNFLIDTSMTLIPLFVRSDLRDRIEATFENAPQLHELMANVSMVFLNRIPAMDFPSLTTHTTVDIGGITTSSGNKSLNEHWSSILSLRPRTILISFGTIALSSDMPEEYKKSILQAIQSFPNVTFICKYEKPDDRISEGIDNLIEASFTPQKEILQDPRVSLFITHCGWASTLETMIAGVPAIAIPISTDQHRNAQVMKRGGGAIVMNKKELVNSEALVRNIKQILENESYRSSSRRTASVIANSPYSGRENFLRNLDFLIKFGPLPNLRIPSHKQSFVEYHMIDVYALISAVPLIAVYFIYTILKSIVRSVLRVGVRKTKKE
ncbi:hypothetical protein PMAYCL1PPCAC_07903, partial [Pristionchus mayeri]